MNHDYLSRQPYLELLKSIISNQKDNTSGYSFAIDGEWGSGKTWILQELEKQLLEEKDNKYLIFHYNAWENDFYDEPLVAILSVIIETLKLQNKSLKEKGSLGKIFSSSITTLTKIAGSIIEAKYNLNPNEIIDSVKDSGKNISDAKLTKSDFNKMLSLENALKQIQDVLNKLAVKQQIIFIVDELDRCLPEYAIKVLERLHHICNEIPVIQILAINKKDLSFGITKVFGMNNPEIDRIKFADKYLQKFIQLFIPLTNGNLNNGDDILNGIDEGFSDAIVINKEYLIEFYKKLMNGITPRTQEYICKQVSLTHKLTVLSGHEMKYYSYGLLCCELMYCIKYCIIRENSDFEILKEEGQIYNLRVCSTSLKCEIISPQLFSSNIESIFRNEYTTVYDVYLGPRAQDKQLSAFSCDKGSAQLMNYFVKQYYVATKWPQVYMMDEVFNSERDFLKYFKEILMNF